MSEKKTENNEGAQGEKRIIVNQSEEKEREASNMWLK